MPFSRNVFDAEFLKFLYALKPSPTRFLDIGPGAGKYGAIIRKQFLAKAIIDAVEIEKTYIAEYSLKNLYDKVENMDAARIPDYPDRWDYDVCIMGDVIEHLRKSDGIDLVNFMLYCCSWLWVVYPENMIQGRQEKKSEVHRSLWSIDDFDSKFINEHFMQDAKHLVILKGLRE